MNRTPLPVWDGISSPILPTASIPRTAEFYRGLGFVVGLFRDGGYAYATATGRAEGVVMHFIMTDGYDPFVGAGMAYVTVGNVDHLHTQIMATGLVEDANEEDGTSRHSTRELRHRWRQGMSLARMTRPSDQPWGMREFAMLDPDNNLIRVGHSNIN